MQITLFTAKCTGNKANCSYPVKAVISSAEELQKAVRADHVCASYKNNYRGIDNFLKSDCLVMDIDNDHSENPEEWITSERIASLFEDVDYALATSRSHMLRKLVPVTINSRKQCILYVQMHCLPLKKILFSTQKKDTKKLLVNFMISSF